MLEDLDIQSGLLIFISFILIIIFIFIYSELNKSKEPISIKEILNDNLKIKGNASIQRKDAL